MPAEVVFGGQQKAVTAEATVSLEGEFIDTRTAPERPASAVAARLAELRGQLSEEDELQQELREEIGNAQDVISQSEHFIEWARQEVEVDLQDVGGTPPPPPHPRCHRILAAFHLPCPIYRNPGAPIFSAVTSHDRMGVGSTLTGSCRVRSEAQENVVAYLVQLDQVQDRITAHLEHMDEIPQELAKTQRRLLQLADP